MLSFPPIFKRRFCKPGFGDGMLIKFAIVSEADAKYQ